MKRNFNLELKLTPPVASGDCYHQPTEETTATLLQDHPQYQPLTIFYNGKLICVSDVTEIQARAILMSAAGRESDEERQSILCSSSTTTPTTATATPSGCGLEPCSPAAGNYIVNLYSPSTGLSMKRSLQRFLQKRKNRIQDASPYHR